MLSLFGKSQSHKCPVPEASQKWIETAFPFLVKLFGEEKIRHKKVLVPHHSDFPIHYDGGVDAARNTLDIVARQMDVTPDDVMLDIYTDGTRSISTGSPMGGDIFLGREEHTDDNTEIPGDTSAYRGRQEDGKLHIWLEQRRLTDPERMVPHFAHELARILIMESIQSEDDPRLAEMTTMMFGLGIFNANTSFLSAKKGYILQREWGYALALFARTRGESHPDWVKYLTRNIRSDFDKSQAYLKDRD